MESYGETKDLSWLTPSCPWLETEMSAICLLCRECYSQKSNFKLLIGCLALKKQETRKVQYMSLGCFWTLAGKI